MTSTMWEPEPIPDLAQYAERGRVASDGPRSAFSLTLEPFVTFVVGSSGDISLLPDAWKAMFNAYAASAPGRRIIWRLRPQYEFPSGEIVIRSRLLITSADDVAETLDEAWAVQNRQSNQEIAA